METMFSLYNPHASITTILFGAFLVLSSTFAELRIKKAFGMRNLLKATIAHLIVVAIMAWIMLAIFQTDIVLALAFTALIAGTHLWFRCIEQMMEI